jgi:cytochrome c-type biogenesis protein CcmH/NrfG
MGLRWTIRSHLLSLVLAVAVPLLGLLIYAAYAEARTSYQQAGAMATTLAQITAGNTQQFLENAQQRLVHLAQHPQLR